MNSQPKLTSLDAMTFDNRFVRICAHHFERKLSKTLTCQFMGKLLVVVTRPEQPRYALRAARS